MKKIIKAVMILMVVLTCVEVGLSWPGQYVPITPSNDQVVVAPTRVKKLSYTDDQGAIYSFNNPQRKRCVIMYQAATNSYGLYELKGQTQH